MNYVIYEGPSLIDGSPIVVIATGINASTQNPKTGQMTQTWILRSDVEPGVAVRTGADAAICGDCSLRWKSCYVNVHFAPQGIYSSYIAGNVGDATSRKARIALGQGRLNRIGSYGDPSVVPIEVWTDLTQKQLGSTGYTHLWQTADPDLKRFCMASTENQAATAQAQERGYRTFRIKAPDDPWLKGEAKCPASNEMGHRLTCAECMACDGKLRGLKGNIAMNVHGTRAKVKRFLKFIHSANNLSASE